MIYFLYALFILACVLLISTVLLQPGKSDAGALFTSSVSSTAFGARGTQTILSKITIGAAAAFMLTAFLLGQPGITGNRSVLDSTATPPIENPVPLTNTNTAVTLDANTANTAEQSANTSQTSSNVNANVSTANVATTTASPDNKANTTASPKKEAPKKK